MKNENASIKTTKTPSQAQLAQKSRFSNIVAAYQLMADFLIGSYEPKLQKVSFYNLFIKYNFGKVNVYLTKEEAEAKSCVVAPYSISHGTLPPIEMSAQGNNLVSSIRLPQGFTITDATTMGEVSIALLSANSFMHIGDQVSIVHLLQSFSDSGIPYVSMKLHKIIITPQDQILFRALIPQSVFQIINGRVGADATEAGGIAYILSRRVANKLHLSTQHIALTPGNTVYQEYSSEAKKKEAVESYGKAFWYVDPVSGLTRQDPEDAYFAITGVTLNGTPIIQGSGSIDISTGEVLVITGSKLTDVGLKARILTNPTGSPTTVGLSTLGSIVSIDPPITVNITTNVEIFYFLRADSDVIAYDFGE
jgi:hypothetical protein